MRHKKTLLSVSAGLIAALMLLSALPDTASLWGRESDYIVKYKSSASGSTVPFKLVSAKEMRRLNREGLLEWYEPDGEAELMGGISPYYADEQWNLEMIGAEAAFRRGCLGEGVRVGVLDSGVNPHPDFGARLLKGHNYMPNVSNPDDTSDSYGHGTRIAGLIAAKGEDGFIGVAPGAEIVPIKVTDGKSVKVSAICEAIYGAIDDYGCTVLNLSMGVRTDYESLREAIAYAEKKNVVVVSAAGNSANSAVYYPAAYDTVIGVGAVDDSGTLYERSNHNPGVSITAPGVDVRSTAAEGGYATSSGTSFAVPQAAGAAALIQSLDKDLTPADIRALLEDTASDCGAEGYDEYYGFGILNIAGCVAALAPDEPEPETPCSFLPETGAATAVRNNTDEDYECIYMLISYDPSGACRLVGSAYIALPPHATAWISPPKGGTRFGQLLHEAGTLTQLTNERISGR